MKKKTTSRLRTCGRQELKLPRLTSLVAPPLGTTNLDASVSLSSVGMLAVCFQDRGLIYPLQVQCLGHVLRVGGRNLGELGAQWPRFRTAIQRYQVHVLRRRLRYHLGAGEHVTSTGIGDSVDTSWHWNAFGRCTVIWCKPYHVMFCDSTWHLYIPWLPLPAARDDELDCFIDRSEPWKYSYDAEGSLAEGNVHLLMRFFLGLPGQQMPVTVDVCDRSCTGLMRT